MEPASQSKNFPLTPAGAVALVLAISIIVIGVALWSQFVGGLQPCALCLYQRVPYIAVIVLCSLALVIDGVIGGARPGILTGVLAVCALAFLIGAGIAAFHVGVEQGWWAGTDSCASPDLSNLDLTELRDRLLQAPVVRCDEVVWSLFGISMAGYNVLVSLGLLGSSLWLFRRARWRPPPA